MKENFKNHRVLKRTILIALIIVAFLICLWLGFRGYMRIPVYSYYKASEQTFMIPEIEDGFIPQGLEYDKNSKTFLVTGYEDNGTPSPMFFVDGESNKLIKKIFLLDKNGNDFCGHAGGLSVYSDRLFIADGDGILVYDYQQAKDAGNCDKLTPLGRVSTKTANDSLGVAFLEVKGDCLYMGEFYREGNYETPKSHRITTAKGDQNPALILEYSLDGSMLKISAKPKKAYSIRGLAQGVCFDDEGDKIYLSTSWGISFSHIYCYDFKNAVQEESHFNVLDETVPLYSLDSGNLISDKKIAPMSEEIKIVNGKMYVMTESASNKYVFGKFTCSKKVYATNIDFFN